MKKKLFHRINFSFLDQDTSSFDIVKATQYGAFDRVQEIIESGFDVNERDEVTNHATCHRNFLPGECNTPPLGSN